MHTYDNAKIKNSEFCVRKLGILYENWEFSLICPKTFIHLIFTLCKTTKQDDDLKVYV